MSEHILFKEEISCSIIKVANEQKVVRWEDLINDLAELIKENYNGKSVKVYRGDWKRKIKVIVKSMGFKLEQFNDDIFVPLETTKNIESSKGSHYTLSASEKQRVVDLYDNIAEKWVLSTGKIVDDEMKKLAEKCCYEHPVHSMILDADDPIWRSYFTIAELNEIKSFRVKSLPDIPEDIQEYLNEYNKEWNSGKELYEYADSQKHNPIAQFNHKWICQSILQASELFLYEDTLTLNEYSEADLLHEVWPFVYKAFKNGGIKAALGEKSSVAVTLGRNKERGLEAVERRTRKAMGARVDILFKVLSKELVSGEVGKSKITAVDDKYLNDGLSKLPKTLRDMLSLLVDENPMQVNNLATIGFLMMGLSIELFVMDIPVGYYITRILRTQKLEFPNSINTFAIDFIPLLEVVWKGKESMKSVVKILSNRKRKAAELRTSVDNNYVLLPPSFVRNSYA
ncbi:hypothetical protein BCV72DRAFT_310646 [Rhizopus microsporus var. microsporus]|uniref:Uncharacterized protein n=2 Tax=Rhizopus microsporus TaxID=58291 RepID=A0A2G4SPL8_RHIZD|nr:uncharacterized protein RHIMIDRAFT_245195 [Rhizopus microsporus ATCC 52813]ORE00766.1 hypothetical protein BCV72DRAFT_310657 [Rhizopus microsporus var. microsporus]ORE00780.1 hypothetical protein BCV72DRAFT_310646 [Rhizopus microsporus var. microsporus]PHZ10710.1 hypothetical protein RHIMIDRAFT_245195 [Rhizopus microsporus ATCC 52813]